MCGCCEAPSSARYLPCVLDWQLMVGIGERERLLIEAIAKVRREGMGRHDVVVVV